MPVHRCSFGSGILANVLQIGTTRSRGGGHALLYTPDRDRAWIFGASISNTNDIAPTSKEKVDIAISNLRTGSHYPQRELHLPQSQRRT